jgi:LmbE family N-acetylglucosaminyl deacetylase
MKTRIILPIIVAILKGVLLLMGVSILALPILQGASQAQGISSEVSYSDIQFASDDRILILAPHPDDEVLGCGGIIQKAQKLNLPLKVVFFTYGDNNEWSFLVYRKHPVIFSKSVQGMGLVRHNEAIEADKVLGLPSEQLVFLGYPDFGTLNIWYNHWNERPPFKSMLTKVMAVPYENAFRPGALYKGEEVLRDLTAILSEFRPTKIFLSHPADHNVDHRALYLFTKVALWNLGIESTVKLYPFLIHYKLWPQPRGHHPQEKLSPPDLYEREISWETSILNADEVTLKENALKKHHSQFEIAAAYLYAFIRKNELFGDFVNINLNEATYSSHWFNSRKAELVSPPEELIDEERASFLGIEEHSIYTEDGNLIFSSTLSRMLAKGVGLSVYLFGYRQGVSFAKMPKIHVRFGALLQAVYDQNKRIALRNSGIRITRQGRQITISIPLQLLGNPERILTSANTYFGSIPLDWVSWRILEILPIQTTKQQ